MSTSVSLETNVNRKQAVVPVLKAGALAALIASVANEALRAATVWIFSISPEFLPLGIGAAAISTTIGLAMATVVMLVVMRFARHIKSVYWTIATVALLVSFIPNVALFFDPDHIAGTTTPGILSLVLMHVVAYAIAVPWLVKAAVTTRGDSDS